MMINLLKWCIRIAWLGAIVLGLLFWGGIFTGALNLHMFLGGVVAFALALLAVYAFVIKVRVPLAIVSLLWAAATLYIGIAQTRLMPGSSHWIIELIHLLLGVGAIGLAEALAAALGRKYGSLS
jgi:hypothetical protein